MRIRLIAPLAIAFLFASAAGAAEAWHRVALAGTGFSVELPGRPAVKTTTHKDGSRSTVVQAVEGPHRGYLARVDQWPPGRFAQARPEQVLVGGRDNLVAGVHGRLRADRPVSQGGIEGREFVIDFTRGGAELTMVCRAFLRGDRAYQLIATMRRRADGDPDARRFLASAWFGGK